MKKKIIILIIILIISIFSIFIIKKQKTKYNYETTKVTSYEYFTLISNEKKRSYK